MFLNLFRSSTDKEERNLFRTTFTILDKLLKITRIEKYPHDSFFPANFLSNDREEKGVYFS